MFSLPHKYFVAGNAALSRITDFNMKHYKQRLVFANFPFCVLNYFLVSETQMFKPSFRRHINARNTAN